MSAIWPFVCPDADIVRAWPLCLIVSFGRLPNRFPAARAASSPANVRSLMISRSNSAKAARMVRNRRPFGVFVSNPMVRILRFIQRSFKIQMRPITSTVSRSSLSSFAAIRLSPDRGNEVFQLRRGQSGALSGLYGFDDDEFLSRPRALTGFQMGDYELSLGFDSMIFN